MPGAQACLAQRSIQPIAARPWWGEQIFQGAASMANQTQHCSQKEEWKGLFQEHSFFFFFPFEAPELF